jgi:hypothetical protein
VRLSYAEGGNTYVYSIVRSLGTLQVVERLEWGREQFPGLTAWGDARVMDSVGFPWSFTGRPR